ncbi:MAG: adenylate/guanylate cyclase domain-containing protein [Magnetococcales bacterium]|nr:adenylate/guanylate cyclase domain-containing protein [Magnetococcales bacterium]
MDNRIRLISGLVLALFITSHLVNHALGIVSIELQDWAAPWLSEPWNHLPLMVLFLTALLLHPLLALSTLQRRHHLRLPNWQRLQIWLGLLILPLLAPHLVKAMMLEHQYHVEVNYALVQFSLWVVNANDGAVQLLLLLVVWTHGTIGVWSLIRLKPWYQRWSKGLIPLAWIIPTLALAGHTASGMQTYRMAATDADLFSKLSKATGLATEMLPPVLQMAAWFQWGCVALAITALMFPVIRQQLSRRTGNRPLLHYNDRYHVPIIKGATLLETLQEAHINHPSLCGGRGRCSTCRVRVSGGSHGSLPDPTTTERQVLTQIGAPDNVRLACQMRVRSELTAWSLLKNSAGPSDVLAQVGQRHGCELDIAVLFADLRGFTAFSEQRLPFDVLFVLNSYFRFMGEAVELQGGRLDKFIGDGVMALFGLDGNTAEGCRNALRAARAMGDNLEQLNASLKEALHEPLRIGIGIHVGPVIVGEMGHGSARQLTAIGDTVNTASRLESLTKSHRAQLIVSEAVFERARVDPAHYPLHQLDIRGRVESMPARILSTATSLRTVL